MTNDEMKPGRFLRLQKGKRIFSSIINHLNNGGSVLICTYTKATKITQKHISMIRMGKSGSVYVQSGKNWNCIDYCGIKLA